MQSITIPFAIQKENSTQEIVTKKIPIKLLAAKIKQEAEWDLFKLKQTCFKIIFWTSVWVKNFQFVAKYFEFKMWLHFTFRTKLLALVNLFICFQLNILS